MLVCSDKQERGFCVIELLNNACMILSVDWDTFSGCREFVFDAPIWGTADLEFDRLKRWNERVIKRGGRPYEPPYQAESWRVLDDDFPLYDGWQSLMHYQGIPTFAVLSHDDIWPILERFRHLPVLNIDSHHDLYNQNGPQTSLRPGNWAGLALEADLISYYTCQYPVWHAHLPVSEGYDLTRTWDEIRQHTQERLRKYDIFLTRANKWPISSQVTVLILVQSPSWTNPKHDEQFIKIVKTLNATILTKLLIRV